MGKLDEICQSVASDVDGALAAALVDLNSGMLMALHHSVPYFTQTYLDAVAAAAVDMFRGKTVSRVEDLLAKQRGESSNHMIQEIQMTTKATYHFMMVVPERPNVLMVLITQRSTNLGMGWSGIKSAMPGIVENTSG